MSIFDLLSAGNESESAGQEPPPGLAALLGTLSGQSPTATTPASGTGLPPASPVDNSMLVPLMLMRAAAEVSQRRAPGQSKTNQNLTALHNSALAGMAYKGDQEDRAQKARKLQMEEAVTAQNLSTAQQAQQQQAELHPLSVMAKRLGITEAEAKVKVEAAKAKYAEEYEKARIESQNATNAAQRALADKRLADIEAGQRKLDLLTTGQQVQGQRMQLAQEQMEINRRKAEEAAIKPFGVNPETGKPAGITWVANGDQFIRHFGEDELTATKTVIKLNESRKQLAASLNQPYVPPTAEQVQREIKLRMSDRTERRGPNGVPVPVAGDVQPGQGAPAAAPTNPAGQPSREALNRISSDYNDVMKVMENDPPGTVRKTARGEYVVMSPDKKSIWRATPEEIQAATAGNKPQASAAPQQTSVSVPAAFEKDLRKYPDAALKGPDGKMYLYNSSKKVVELVGEDKPYKRLFEP